MFNFNFFKKIKILSSKNIFKYANLINLKKFRNLQFRNLQFRNFNFKFYNLSVNLYYFVDIFGYTLKFFYFKANSQLLNFHSKFNNFGKLDLYFADDNTSFYSKNFDQANVELDDTANFNIFDDTQNLYSFDQPANFIEKNKFITDINKFMYYDNLNFSFYFLNFFKQFKYNIIYLLFTKNCSFNTALDFFKISTSFNFFYFINLAPNSVISSLGGSLCSNANINVLNNFTNTNHTPIFFFSDFIKTKFLSFFKSSNTSQFTFFYQYFLIQSLEFILNCKIYIKVFSLLKLIIFLKKNQFIQFIKSKYKYFNSKIGKGFFLVEVIEVF